MSLNKFKRQTLLEKQEGVVRNPDVKPVKKVISKKKKK